MTVATGSAELTLFFVFDVFVPLARTSGAMAIGSGIAVAAFTHFYSEF